jgi:hypothetical protein
MALGAGPPAGVVDGVEESVSTRSLVLRILKRRTCDPP